MNSPLPYLTADELQALFGYPTPDAFHMAVSRGSFPVPTYRIRNRIVADKEVVKEFFNRQRREGLAKLNASMASEGKDSE